MSSARFHGVCNTRNASTPFCRMPAFCGSSCVTPSRAATCNRMPCSGTMSNVPSCLPASRKTTCGTVQAFVAFTPGPARLMLNCCWPSVLPGKCSVMTRPAVGLQLPSNDSTPKPLIDSTSKPPACTKLRRKIPARVMFTVAFTASTVRSSPSESVSCVSTRTSGSTARSFHRRPCACASA